MPTKPRRLLLFEDDYESMQDVKEYIEEEIHWEVVLSAQTDILERLRHEQFDVVVVDLMIHPTSFDAEGRQVENVHFVGVPWVKTGLEFLRRLRKGELRGGGGGERLAHGHIPRRAGAHSFRRRRLFGDR